MRVANLEMTQPNQQCPPGFRTITASGKRLCGRPGPAGCVSVKFPTNNVPYNRVRGRVIAYQYMYRDGQCPYIGFHTDQNIQTLEEVYGVSIIAVQDSTSGLSLHLETQIECGGCPCYPHFTGTPVPFIGDNFFCDSGAEIWQGWRLYDADPLWDGQGCGKRNECCTFNNPPWFCTELDQHTSDDMELRLCADIRIQVMKIFQLRSLNSMYSKYA